MALTLPHKTDSAVTGDDGGRFHSKFTFMHSRWLVNSSEGGRLPGGHRGAQVGIFCNTGDWGGPAAASLWPQGDSGQISAPFSCVVKRHWWMVLNTEDTYDPDTQLSETEAAWEMMPHSNLHAVRMLLIAHSVIGAGQTTLLPVRLILEAKKTVQRPVQPFTSWTPRSWTKEVKLDRIKGQANTLKLLKYQASEVIFMVWRLFSPLLQKVNVLTLDIPHCNPSF